MTNIFFQLLVNGLIAGAMYALVALGFSLIYSTNRFANFAHGGVIALSANLFWFFSEAGLNFFFSAFITVIFSAFLGYAINALFFRPLRAKKSSSSVLLVSSIAVLILLESSALLIFGADVKTIHYIESTQGMDLILAIITPLQISIILISILLSCALFILLKKSKLGMAMRAVADNKDVAEIVGISSEKIYSWSFIIGSAIAGCAAVFISLEQNVSPGIGGNLMIKGFTGAIIGGATNVPGALFGSLLLGMAENFGIWFLPSGYKDAVAFSLLFIFLLFRPQGLFGIRNPQK